MPDDASEEDGCPRLERVRQATRPFGVENARWQRNADIEETVRLRREASETLSRLDRDWAERDFAMGSLNRGTRKHGDRY